MDRLDKAREFMTKHEEFFKGHKNKGMTALQKEGTDFIIAYLHKHRDKTIYAGELAKDAGVTTARIAAALRGLEQQGYIVRSASQSDSRKTEVRLTAEGERRGSDMLTHFLGVVADVLDYVGEVDMEEFMRIAKRIDEAIGQKAPKGGSDV